MGLLDFLIGPVGSKGYDYVSGGNDAPPAATTYGGGMAETLKTQTDFLKGTGEFEDIGSLESLLPLEESIRKKTAQIDTDVLRQTLLGSQQKVVKDPETGKYGIPGAEPVTNDQGQVQSAEGGRYQIVSTDPGKVTSSLAGGDNGLGATYSILDTETGGVTETFGGTEYGSGKRAEVEASDLKAVSAKFKSLQTTIDEADGDTSVVAQTFDFTNPNTGEPLKEGDVVRQEDGMVDLLGDKRGVQNTVAKGDYKEYVQNNKDINDQFITARQSGDTRTIEEFGKEHYDSFGKAEGRELSTTYEQVDAGRQAGFDAAGNFLGLSAFGEDIQAGNLSRQR